MINNQKPEPFAQGDGKSLDVHSVFYTIQGEGPFAGHRAVFVRLAGCSLMCPACDTLYTTGRRVIPLEELTAMVQQIVAHDKNPLVVITGGEPLRQSVGPFVRKLISLMVRVQIESNGMFEPDEDLLATLKYEMACLVISPKTPKVNRVAAQYASAFKYVLDYTSVHADGLPIVALGLKLGKPVARPPIGKPIYLNPVDTGNAEHNKRNLEAVVDSCMTFGYIAGVQMHKYLGVA